MKHTLFRNANYVMGAFGFFLGLGMYIVHKTLQIGLFAVTEEAIWMCFTAILVFLGLVNGKMIRMLHHWAYCDFLTGVWNRKYFHYRLNKELQDKRKKQQKLCIALVDVDDFKQVNDTYGHSAGDKVIKKIANVLIKNVRKTDAVIRLGGDEFAIIFSETEIKKAKMISERIRSSVDHQCEHVTVSVGVVEFKKNLKTAEIIDFVDAVLYKAKLSKNAVITMIAG